MTQWRQFYGLVFVLMIAAPSATCLGQNGQATRGQSQDADKPEGYVFTVDRQLYCSPVKSQDNTGTCWSYTAVSFLESELVRMGKGEHDLSEMFIVRNVYLEKAQNFLLRQGKAQFSQGALTHDYLRAAGRHGLVPEAAYSGLVDGAVRHDHSELEAVASSLLATFAKQPKLSKKWRPLMENLLDVYLGSPPTEFSYNGKDYTPRSFADELGFRADDYLHFTSFSHHPFGKSFVLEIPDNFSSGSFMNVPLDDLVAIIDRAIDEGFTVAWDGDVSERSFLRNEGIAVMPDASNPDFSKNPGPEEVVDQERRQEAFESLATADDHLMHLVGRAFDQRGTKYYIIKNSWGEIGRHRGFLYMSEPYLRAKTIAITVHRDGVKRIDD